jgi:hypothetical protein
MVKGFGINVIFEKIKELTKQVLPMKNRKRNRYSALLLLMPLLLIQCKKLNMNKTDMASENIKYAYKVKKSTESHDINSKWDKEIWEKTKSIRLNNFMGDSPSHFPETNVKLRYDRDNIYVIFNVNDRYIKAVEKETHGRVWEDSCVEFFFTPGPDIERGYFNFEANCKGVFLFKYHLGNSETNGTVSLEDCKKIKISPSLSRNVEQESAEPENWTLEYNIPISILSKYMKVDQPKPGASWRANFYKCADKSSHPHWLTWAPIDYPEPQFHLPEFFGELNFE